MTARGIEARRGETEGLDAQRESPAGTARTNQGTASMTIPTPSVAVEQVALDPCPFCGSSSCFVERADFSACYVACNFCGVRGPSSCDETAADADGSDSGACEPGELPARRLWNQRATFTAPAREAPPPTGFAERCAQLVEKAFPNESGANVAAYIRALSPIETIATPGAGVTQAVERLMGGDLLLEHHPMNSGDHRTGDMARQIVGAYHSKSDFVQIVTALLRLAHSAPSTPDASPTPEQIEQWSEMFERAPEAPPPVAPSVRDDERKPWGLTISAADLARLYEGSKRDALPVGSEIRQLIGEIRWHRSRQYQCAARKSVGANNPQDCNWPICGCDPEASKVIDALKESGFSAAPPPVAGEGWSFNTDTRDIECGNAPVFKVYEADDFPCLEDEERGQADEWYDAQAQTLVLMFNGLLHASGDDTPIPMPEALSPTPAQEPEPASDPAARETIAQAILAKGIPGGSVFDRDDRSEMAYGWADAVLAALTSAPSQRPVGLDGETIEACARVAEKREQKLIELNEHRPRAEHRQRSGEASLIAHIIRALANPEARAGDSEGVAGK